MATWFNWSKDRGLPIERMEDLVFVYGCTLVTSWAAAAFDDYTGNAQLSLACRTLNNGGSGFIWSNIRGTVEYHDSQLNPVCSLLATVTCRALTFFFLCPPEKNIPYLPQNRCAFIKCLRVKHVLFWTDVAYCRRISFAENPDDGFSDTEASYNALSDTEASYNALSDDEAPDHTVSSYYEALFHASRASYPYEPNSLSDNEAPDDTFFDDASESSDDALPNDEAPDDTLFLMMKPFSMPQQHRILMSQPF